MRTLGPGDVVTNLIIIRLVVPGIQLEWCNRSGDAAQFDLPESD